MTVSQKATIRQNDAFGSRLENGRDSKENTGEIYTKCSQDSFKPFCHFDHKF